MRNGIVPAALLLVASCVGALPAQAQTVELERYATGLDMPVFLTAPRGDTDRLFVVEQHAGAIRIIRTSDRSVLPIPFLTISGLPTGFEQGLLGLAFDPNYSGNRYFYVYYTDPDSKIVRYQVGGNPDVAKPDSERPILEFSQPNPNHNGGWIGFGDDGYLYIATGDGGGGNDVGPGHTQGTGNAQDIDDNLLGKILRIDVHADDFPADLNRNYAVPSDNPFVNGPGDDEIWAYGLRNPWRPSFDRLEGDFWIADVGQGACEEVNVQPFNSTGGENYGWRLREGTIQTPGDGIGGAHPPGAIDPILDYPHGSKTCAFSGAPGTGVSVTGGYVYRGPKPDLQGRYFFADYGTQSQSIWSIVWDGTSPNLNDGTNYSDFIDHSNDPNYGPDVGSLSSISSFGEDALGNLYVLDLFGGEIFRVPEPESVLLRLVGVAGLIALGRARRQRR